MYFRLSIEKLKEFDIRIGKILANHRKAIDLTQSDIAGEFLKIQTGAVGAWERGGGISVKQFLVYCSRIGIEPWTLLAEALEMDIAYPHLDELLEALSEAYQNISAILKKTPGRQG